MSMLSVCVHLLTADTAMEIYLGAAMEIYLGATWWACPVFSHATEEVRHDYSWSLFSLRQYPSKVALSLTYCPHSISQGKGVVCLMCVYFTQLSQWAEPTAQSRAQIQLNQSNPKLAALCHQSWKQHCVPRFQACAAMPAGCSTLWGPGSSSQAGCGMFGCCCTQQEGIPWHSYFLNIVDACGCSQ